MSALSALSSAIFWTSYLNPFGTSESDHASSIYDQSLIDEKDPEIAQGSKNIMQLVEKKNEETYLTLDYIDKVQIVAEKVLAHFLKRGTAEYQSEKSEKILISPEGFCNGADPICPLETPEAHFFATDVPAAREITAYLPLNKRFNEKGGNKEFFKSVAITTTYEIGGKVLKRKKGPFGKIVAKLKSQTGGSTLAYEQRMQKLLNRHPSFCKIYHTANYFLDKNGKVFERVMYTELCDQGDLNRYFEFKDAIECRELPFLILDVLEGLTELENQECIHGDFKPLNVFVASCGHKKSKVRGKISDFGSARFLHTCEDVKRCEENWRAGKLTAARPKLNGVHKPRNALFNRNPKASVKNLEEDKQKLVTAPLALANRPSVDNGDRKSVATSSNSSEKTDAPPSLRSVRKSMVDESPKCLSIPSVGGTPFYYSPERHKNNVSSMKDDIWGFGVGIYLLLNKEDPVLPLLYCIWREVERVISELAPMDDGSIADSIEQQLIDLIKDVNGLDVKRPVVTFESSWNTLKNRFKKQGYYNVKRQSLANLAVALKQKIAELEKHLLATIKPPRATLELKPRTKPSLSIVGGMIKKVWGDNNSLSEEDQKELKAILEELVQDCMHIDPEQRLSASALYNKYRAALQAHAEGWEPAAKDKDDRKSDMPAEGSKDGASDKGDRKSGLK